MRIPPILRSTPKRSSPAAAPVASIRYSARSKKPTASVKPKRFCARSAAIEQIRQRAIELTGALVVKCQHLGALFAPSLAVVLERLGDRAVQVHAPRVRQRVEQCLARQRMTKAILAGVLFDDARFHAELERIERRLRIESCRTPRDLERKAQPDERRRRQQAFRITPQPANTVPHGIEEIRGASSVAKLPSSRIACTTSSV